MVSVRDKTIFYLPKHVFEVNFRSCCLFGVLCQLLSVGTELLPSSLLEL